MSYQSFLKTLPDSLHLPTAIAAVASLGIHGLLALSLPTLSASSKPEEQQKGTVKVVELTPAEQRRLPQSSQATQPLPETIPPPNVPLPPNPLNSNRHIPILRLSKLEEGDNRGDFLGETPGETLSASRRHLDGNIREPDSRIVAVREFSIPQSQQDNNRTQDSKASDKPTVIRPSENATVDPTIARGSAEDLKPQRSTTENTTLARQTQDSNPQPPTAENADSASGLAEHRKRRADDRTRQQTALAQQRQQALLAEIEQRRRDITRDDTDTSLSDAQRNYVDWSVKQKIAQKPEEITITGSYPQDACIKKLEGTPVVGVSVDANNNISTMPLKSSGYPILNKKALEDVVKSGKLNNKTGKPKTYLVYVKYQYNNKICPGLSLPQSPKADG